MKAKSIFSLKDQLFNAGKVEYFAGLFVKAYPEFSSQAFQRDVVKAFPNLELKERIVHITTCLHQYLPDRYPQALEIILRALPPELDPQKTDDDFGDFILSPLALFVATHGCSSEHLNLSLSAIKEMTKRFSAEYAIRFFINTFPDESISFLMDCATDDNYHVRRLTSEGTRPKLPWAQKLNINFDTPLPILEQLYADKTRYVTRSVANHLNDISKISPDLVIETLKRWKKSRKQNDKEMAFIARHALRTLIKQGNQDALAFLGFGGKPDITIKEFVAHTPTVKVGEAFEFSLSIHANKQQNLVVDYLMIFAGNNNQQGNQQRKKSGQKVFKIKELALKKGDVIEIKKKHPMRLMTTRRLYPGEHQVLLQVNGQNLGSLVFELVE